MGPTGFYVTMCEKEKKKNYTNCLISKNNTNFYKVFRKHG